MPSSGGRLRFLAQLHDDKLRGTKRREPDEDVHDPSRLVHFRRGVGVDLDEVRVVARAPGERTVAELNVHEAADRRAKARPQWLVVGLEYGPLDAVVDARPEED